MKKIFLVLLLSITNFAFGQYITGLSVTQNGTNQIKVNLKIYLPSVGEFKNHQININQNTVTLSACYFMTDFGGITNLENNFLIEIPDNNNYTLIVKMYTSSDPTICNYNNLEDTVAMDFSTPIEGTVSLATDENNTKSENISLFPVPTKDVLNIKSNEKIHKVNLYDASGKKLSPLLENNKINTTNLDNGIYFLEIYTGKNTYRRKFTIQK